MTYQIQTYGGMTEVKTTGAVPLAERLSILKELHKLENYSSTGLLLINHKDATLDMSMEEADAFAQEIADLCIHWPIIGIFVVVNNTNRMVLDMAIGAAKYMGVPIEACESYREALTKSSRQWDF